MKLRWLEMVKNQVMGKQQEQEEQEQETPEIHPEFKKFWVENGDKVSELINVGGWSPTGYGDIQEDEDTLYGRIGLTEEEFLLHVHFISKISGMVAILGNDHLQWLQDRIEEEWQRIEKKKQNSEN